MISGRPGYLLTETSGAASVPVPGNDYQWNPDKSPTGPVSIVFSTRSSRIYVFRSGIEIGRAVVPGAEDLRTGTHAYTALDKFYPDGRREWSVIDTIGDEPAPNLHDLAAHLAIPPDFMTQMRSIVIPGTTLVLSDAPIDRSQPLESNVNILTTQVTKKPSSSSKG